MQRDYDIVIAGGGMVGASLALALADTKLRIAVVEPVKASADQQPSYDDRGIALSLSSRRIFEALEVWPELVEQASPIRHIHVSDRGRFGKVRMNAEKLGLDALGHVVVARQLGSVLLRKLKELPGVDFICPARVGRIEQESGRVSFELEGEPTMETESCKLLISADGTDSAIRRQLGLRTREHDYRQTLIVANVSTELSHKDTAFERFTPEGPLALLPLKSNRCVLVFGCPEQQAAHYMGLAEEDFLEEVSKRFGKRLGGIHRLGKRRAYPMKAVQAEQQSKGRVLLLGNSAHTIHPNGAQGFNLCLRDVAGLAECLKRAELRDGDPGSKLLLDEYLLMRTADQQRVSEQSHNMTRWFYNDRAAPGFLRNMAMTLIDLLPPAREELMRRGMGIHGLQPGLVRGIQP